MSVLVLNEPCTKLLPHSPHPIVVMSPYAPAMVSTLSCPGWAPAAASTSANPPPPPERPELLPDPVVPSS